MAKMGDDRSGIVVDDPWTSFTGRVGSSVKELRVAEGYTQEELARLSGVSVRTITKVESGDGGLRLASAVGIANALGVSLDQLVGGRR